MKSSPSKKRLQRVVVINVPVGPAVFGFMTVMSAYIISAVFFDRLTTIVNNSIALALSVSAIINMIVVRHMFRNLRYEAMDILRDIGTLDTEDPETVRENDANSADIIRISVPGNKRSS